MNQTQLYQVNVETRDGRVVAVGPKASERQFCERLVVAINAQIIAGRERLWANPHIVTTPAVL